MANALFLWGMALSVLIAWWYAERSYTLLGLTFGAPGTLMASIAVVVLIVAVGARLHRLYLRLYEKSTVIELLPRTPREFRLFSMLAVSAGITEEIFYRGYLIWYLQQFMSLSAAAVVSTLWFAAAHAYQGARAVVVITLLGGVLAGLYVWSGSLLAPIVLHAIIDLYAGVTGYRMLSAKPSVK
jgi:membrane protease YdiL (CAAX protease family)